MGIKSKFKPKDNTNSLFSFMSVSIILLAFLVALNAPRVNKLNPKVEYTTADNQQIASNKNEKTIMLRTNLPLKSIFYDKTDTMTDQGYKLANAITDLISNQAVKTLLVLNTSSENQTDLNNIELGLKRSNVLQRLFQDLGVDNSVLRITTSIQQPQLSDSLSVVFHEQGLR